MEHPKWLKKVVVACLYSACVRHFFSKSVQSSMSLCWGVEKIERRRINASSTKSVLTRIQRIAFSSVYCKTLNRYSEECKGMDFLETTLVTALLLKRWLPLQNACLSLRLTLEIGYFILCFPNVSSIIFIRSVGKLPKAHFTASLRCFSFGKRNVAGRA